MLEYKVSSGLNTTVYKRYNKKYTTPPIFNYYKFNPILCGLSIGTSIILAFLTEAYQYIIGFDICLAIAYLVSICLVKPMYQFGLINKSVYYHTASYNFAKFMAFNSQAAVWRVIIPGIVIVSKEIDFDDVLFLISPFVGIIVGCISIFSVFGICAKMHFYNKTAQKAYNAILEGPKSLNEEAKTIIGNSLDFTIVELLHPDVATREFFLAQEKFNASVAELQLLLKDYDTLWRNAIVYSNFSCAKTMGTNPCAQRLANVLQELSSNVNELNEISIKLNEMEYVPKQPTIKIKASVPKRKAEPIPKKTSDFWGNVANWYN